MYAVIRTGGKQYRVAENDVIRVEKLAGAAGEQVEFGEVLMLGNGADSDVGAPLVDGARVMATILDQARGPKIVVFKKKRRKNYRRTRGHRQDVTVLRVTDILPAGAKPTAKPAKAEEAPKKADKAKPAAKAEEAPKKAAKAEEAPKKVGKAEEAPKKVAKAAAKARPAKAVPDKPAKAKPAPVKAKDAPKKAAKAPAKAKPAAKKPTAAKKPATAKAKSKKASTSTRKSATTKASATARGPAKKGKGGAKEKK